jgi:hypothetical protein
LGGQRRKSRNRQFGIDLHQFDASQAVGDVSLGLAKSIGRLDDEQGETRDRRSRI